MALRRAWLTALLVCGCSSPDIEHHAVSAFLFETRDTSGAVPSASAATDTALFLEPDQPAATGHGGPLASADGSRQLTLADWLRPTGVARVRCDGDATRIELSLEGLVPGGVYTAWVLVTTAPLAYNQERIPTFFSQRDFIDPQFVIFLGPAGLPGGEDAHFIADAGGGISFVRTVHNGPAGQESCLLSSPNWFVVIDYHADGNTYGPLARPTQGTTAQAAHVGFAFAFEEPVTIPLP